MVTSTEEQDFQEFRCHMTSGLISLGLFFELRDAFQRVISQKEIKKERKKEDQ